MGRYGSYMLPIRDQKIYERLDALYDKMPEKFRNSGFNENGRRPDYGEYYFERADIAKECSMCHVYKRSVLRKCADSYPLNSLCQKLDEMKEIFDIIEEVILDSIKEEKAKG